jgi:hypothetical protein
VRARALVSLVLILRRCGKRAVASLIAARHIVTFPRQDGYELPFYQYLKNLQDINPNAKKCQNTLLIKTDEGYRLFVFANNRLND